MLSIQEKIALPLTGAAAQMADWGRGKLEVEPLGNLIEQRMTVTHAIRRRDVVNRRYWWERFLKIDTVVTHLRIESPRA
ncbi:hypothetical protein NS359_08035 [Curtobacterium oceanosedimentum]|uniref:Uncharacterized protein n=2 Tax=Curtobacterium oceanosedimentum TaxID=465820 RepID=A0A147DR27_9MICO|nr:hypothetical protein NS359_08035 [Curtobacterium oceanosedimentum]